jgi:hypothetical protein
MAQGAFNCSWTFLGHSLHILTLENLKDSENKQQMLHYGSIFSAAAEHNNNGIIDGMVTGD